MTARTKSSAEEKVFKLRINGKTVHVTKDRLKPAYTIAENLIPAERNIPATRGNEEATADQQKNTSPEVKTRSGRMSHKTVRFQSLY